MKARNLILLVALSVGLAASCSDETRDDCVNPKPEHISVCCADDPSLSYCKTVEDMDIDLPVSDMGGDDGPVEDMPEVDMPEDEGQPDQSTPCDSACGGQTPICDVATDTCVQCLTNNECGDGLCDTNTKSCVECLGDEDCTQGVCLEGNTTQDNACVECRGNAQCLDAQASLCSAANECAPCAADADCSHLQDLGQCVAGTCRECTTESEATDCAGNVCDPTTYTCTNLPIGGTSPLQPCDYDSQCNSGLCISLVFNGAPHGTYCMPLPNPGCSAPYGAGGQTRTSVNGQEEVVCMISSATTPEAVNNYNDECAEATAATDCPHPGQRCEVFDQLNTTRCTYSCSGSPDCKQGATCVGNPGAEYCRP